MIGPAACPIVAPICPIEAFLRLAADSISSVALAVTLPCVSTASLAVFATVVFCSRAFEAASFWLARSSCFLANLLAVKSLIISPTTWASINPTIEVIAKEFIIFLIGSLRPDISDVTIEIDMANIIMFWPIIPAPPPPPIIAPPPPAGPVPGLGLEAASCWVSFFSSTISWFSASIRSWSFLFACAVVPAALFNWTAKPSIPVLRSKRLPAISLSGISTLSKSGMRPSNCLSTFWIVPVKSLSTLFMSSPWKALYNGLSASMIVLLSTSSVDLIPPAVPWIAASRGATASLVTWSSMSSTFCIPDDAFCIAVFSGVTDPVAASTNALVPPFRVAAADSTPLIRLAGALAIILAASPNAVSSGTAAAVIAVKSLLSKVFNPAPASVKPWTIGAVLIDCKILSSIVAKPWAPFAAAVKDCCILGNSSRVAFICICMLSAEEANLIKASLAIWDPCKADIFPPPPPPGGRTP